MRRGDSPLLNPDDALKEFVRRLPDTIKSAILDALRSRGDVALEMPFTAEKLWKALRTAKRGQEPFSAG